MLKIDIDPLPDEPPEYKIHSESKGWIKVWVVTKEDKLKTVMPDRALACSWIDIQKQYRKRRRV